MNLQTMVNELYKDLPENTGLTLMDQNTFPEEFLKHNPDKENELKEFITLFREDAQLYRIYDNLKVKKGYVVMKGDEELGYLCMMDFCP